MKARTFNQKLVAYFAAIIILSGGISWSGELRKYEFFVGGRGVADVDMLWENIDGFGAISGTFSYIKLDIDFVGKNPKSGFLWMKVDNESYVEYRKVKKKDGTVWVGESENGERLELRPVKVKGTDSKKPSPNPKGTVRNYTLIGNGGKKAVRLAWENINGLAPVNGTISGENYKGSNTAKGKLTLVSDDGGTTYQLTRNSTENSTRWEGKVYFAQDDTGVDVMMIMD